MANDIQGTTGLIIGRPRNFLWKGKVNKNMEVRPILYKILEESTRRTHKASDNRPRNALLLLSPFSPKELFIVV